MPIEVEGGGAEINEYFAGHPDRVLGRLYVGRGVYGAEELMVERTGEVAPALRAGLEAIAEHAKTAGLTMTPPDRAGATPEPLALVGRSAARPEGFIEAAGEGFTEVRDGAAVPLAVPKTQSAELRALLGLRDAVVGLLEAEAATRDDTTEIGRLRADLNQRYEAYIAAYGPLNRCSWRRTGRVDPDTGAERLGRVRPRRGGFRTDPFAPVVDALEIYDAEDNRATKAAIFHRRVVAPPPARLGAESPADALAICLDDYGEVRLSEIARLLGADETTTRAELDLLVFDEPGTGQLVPAPEYLSGNVRAKLAAVTQAAADDSRYEANVSALRAVIPEDLGPDAIDARLGAAWIADTYVEEFLRETLDDPTVAVEHAGGSQWVVKGGLHGVLATSTWGTARRPAGDLAQSMLTQSKIEVRDQIEGGGTVPNPTETIAAQEKAAELAERFREWLWEDPERTEALVRTYNDRFNAIVLRSYDEAQPALPGLALSFEPRPHQLAAVARMVAEPATLLAHEVGAGKTAAMAMGVMELKRLGLVAKPALVVPNHMVEQFSREFLQLYPQARLLVGTKEDLAGSEGRRRFTARAATGEWDAVIVSHSAFERIPLSESARGEYLGRERDRVRRWLDNSKQRGGLSVKRLERKLLEAEERLKRRLETGKADEGITFEQTGIDYLCVDEAHLFKNLATSSNIPGASIEGSERAQDLDMKLDWLRRRKPGGRIVTFATATPVANSITEAYVVQRYLRPDLLEEAGIEDFDTWAATFGEVVSGVELTPDATTFRIKSRFAKFTNVPELLTMLHVAADVKTAEDLGLPTPTLAGGGPETVVVASSPELAALVAELGERAEAVRSRAVRPEEDNMLKISGDGRAAALDLRLVGRARPEGPAKIDVAAEHIAAIWAEHRHDRYLDATGGPHPRSGALQLVFCELGTPAERWNVYDELQSQLVARGIPPEAVRFIHEAKDDRAKAELFAACRAGSVAVLVGSTEKMGVGTNVQDRAVALHHLDCPWRPADLAQRDGRILRQGNQNPEVRVLRYVTEGSFDTYMWQTVERKARFIGQLMRGRLDVRDIEDIGDAALSYAEVKALAAGDPRLIEAAQVDAEVAKLERLARAWARNQDRLRRQVAASEHHIAGLQVELAQAEAAAAHPVDLRGERFTMSVEGRPYRRRGDAGAALIGRLSTEASRLSAFDERRLGDLGELGGQRLVGTVRRDSQGRHAELSLEGVPRSRLQLPEADLHPGRAAGVIARLEHRLEAIPTLPETIGVEITEARREQDRARAGITERFPQAERLADVQERSAQLAAQLADLASPHHDTAHPPAQLCATYERLTAEERATRVRAAITPGLPPDAVERVLEAVERAELAGADPTGLCCRAGLGALAEEDLLHQITSQTYSARPQAAYAGILPPPAPSADPAISEQLQRIGCQLEAWREELAQQLDSAEPPPQWAAPLGRPPADPATRSAWAAHVAQVGVWRAARCLTENDLYGPEHDLSPLLAAARARAVAAGRAARQAATDSRPASSLTRPARMRHPSPGRPQLPAVRMRP
ncbi:MAG: helicase [Actinomycetota bacterium]|nr:helicase [Actinomycetota bacterium]